MSSGEVAEVAKATRAVVEAGQGVGRFFSRLFGGLLEDAVALKWGDRITAKRLEASITDWERLQTLAHMATQRLRDQGVVSAAMPEPKILLPLLEAATMETDDELLTLWANLLARAMSDEENDVGRQHISILADLSGHDALALRDYYSQWTSMDLSPFPDSGMIYGPGMDGDNYGFTVSRNLVRLGLLEPSYVEFQTFEPGGHDDRYGDYDPTREPLRVPGDLTVVAMTGFGLAFCEALGLQKGEATDPQQPARKLPKWARQGPWRG